MEQSGHNSNNYNNSSSPDISDFLKFLNEPHTEPELPGFFDFDLDFLEGPSIEMSMTTSSANAVQQNPSLPDDLTSYTGEQQNPTSYNHQTSVQHTPSYFPAETYYSLNSPITQTPLYSSTSQTPVHYPVYQTQIPVYTPMPAQTQTPKQHPTHQTQIPVYTPMPAQTQTPKQHPTPQTQIPVYTPMPAQTQTPKQHPTHQTQIPVYTPMPAQTQTPKQHPTPQTQIPVYTPMPAQTQTPKQHPTPHTPLYYPEKTYPFNTSIPQIQTPVYRTVVKHLPQTSASVRTQRTPLSTHHHTSGIYRRNSDNYFSENCTQPNYIVYAPIVNQIQKKRNRVQTSSCPTPGCDGMGNKNKKYKTHRSKSGCPRSRN